MRFSQKLLVVATMLVILGLFAPFNGFSDQQTGLNEINKSFVNILNGRSSGGLIGISISICLIFATFSTLPLNIFVILEQIENAEYKYKNTIPICSWVNVLAIVVYAAAALLTAGIGIGVVLFITGVILSIVGWQLFIAPVEEANG